MAVLGQTISGVAHELNNPLASILMWAERMARKQAGPEIRQGLDTILHEAERAARIVRHLLTFARKRHSTRATVDVNDVVRDTLALRQHEQRLGNIVLIDALAVGLPHVFADPHQLQQVLLNLVINAEQAMTTTAGRGTLVVRTWHDGERDVVLLEVSDDGPGLAPEVLPRIFDPFFTTKEVGQGTGLGLTVAYAIIQEHGGAITAHSAPGEGATFRIELPTASTKPAKRPDPAVGLSPEPRAGAAVLLVEDEPGLASAVVECLGDAGYVVTHAGDGQAGLDAIAAPDLRRDHLRPEDAAAGRPGVLPGRRRALPGAGAAGDLRDRRRRRHRRGALPRRERLPLAAQAVPAVGAAAGGPRRDRVGHQHAARSVGRLDSPAARPGGPWPPGRPPATWSRSRRRAPSAGAGWRGRGAARRAIR